jgi:hypothetical protein
MTTIPELCMQYTHIFNTVRLEHAVSLVVGLVVGLIYMHLNK